MTLNSRLIRVDTHEGPLRRGSAAPGRTWSVDHPTRRKRSRAPDKDK